MNAESSQNYYYRYKILSGEDVSAETIHRRHKKIKNNSTKAILFDLSEATEIDLLDFKKLQPCLSNQHRNEFLVSLKWFQHLLNSTDHINNYCFHVRIHTAKEFTFLDKILTAARILTTNIHIHISPQTTSDLDTFRSVQCPIENKYGSFFWDFRPYNDKIKYSLTVKNIGQFFKLKGHLQIEKQFVGGLLPGLEIWNCQIPTHYELEPDTSIQWQFSTPSKKPKISVVIPSFNNAKFLANVINHLIHQSVPAEDYEIVVVEDGGTDHTSEIIQTLFKGFASKVNLKFIYWSKLHPEKGQQNFFRAGLARNLGVQFTEGEYLFFLDSDMLVPAHFIETCLNQLKTNDIIQFQRYHIHQSRSASNPSFEDINLDLDTYVEEKNYWMNLFSCSDWSTLPHFWKYTCTYALGMKKDDFYAVGRFKKYYISYGFEDTDLGYEMYKRNKKFKLVRSTLLHLTAYDQMQYQNSQVKRIRLLKTTSALFYLQHLHTDIFETFQNFYRFEKPLVNKIKDWL